MRELLTLESALLSLLEGDLVCADEYDTQIPIPGSTL
jgi:hypothetical protein